jgi:hypothetical protein
MEFTRGRVDANPNPRVKKVTSRCTEVRKAEEAGKHKWLLKIMYHMQ